MQYYIVLLVNSTSSDTIKYQNKHPKMSHTIWNVSYDQGTEGRSSIKILQFRPRLLKQKIY